MDETTDVAVDMISDDDSHSESDSNASLETTEGSDEGDLVLAHSHEGVRIDKNDRSLSEFRR